MKLYACSISVVYRYLLNRIDTGKMPSSSKFYTPGMQIFSNAGQKREISTSLKPVQKYIFSFLSSPHPSLLPEGEGWGEGIK